MGKIENILSIQKDLFRYALSLTKNHHDAEDLIQETNIKLLKSNIENKVFKNFSLRSLHNQFIDNTRAKKIQYEYCDNIEVAEEEKDIEQQIKELRKAIYKLPKERREVALLYFRGYLYREIASILNKDIGTVKSYLYWSKKDLYKILSN